MRWHNRCVFLGLTLLLTWGQGYPAAPSLKVEGGRNDPEWVVKDPQELVVYRSFDTRTVADRCPAYLAYVTVGELAGEGHAWAREELKAHPGHRTWGISFLELVRSRVFQIRGRSLDWPPHGALLLWSARVRPREPEGKDGGGSSYLLLEFRVPDQAYAAYMSRLGYPACFGRSRLWRDGDGVWRGQAELEDLRLTCSGFPRGEVQGPLGLGCQVLWGPQKAPHRAKAVRVFFRGHRIQDCSRSTWAFQGEHPLVRSQSLGSTTLQWGYELEGGLIRTEAEMIDE